jgi:hypothetical protein
MMQHLWLYAPPTRAAARHLKALSCITSTCRVPSVERHMVYGVRRWMTGSVKIEKKWLAELLPNVCPFHKDSFPVTLLEEA